MKNSGCLEIGYGDGISTGWGEGLTNEEYWPIWDVIEII